MAGTCLPDEILAPILHSVLHIPTAKFFKFESQTDEPRSRSLVHDDTPPFKANRAWPLQVCKQWLRVGTPLLYESLRLSQKEHTDALVALLDKASYVGAMVFNLRVDGRNGTSMDLGRVVRHMPNVENLFIYVETWSTPDTMGLREALPLLNPLRLFLDEGMSSCGIVVSNEARKAVWKAVNEHWTQLWCVDFSWYFRIDDECAETFRGAPALELIRATGTALQDLITGRQLKTIAANPALVEVQSVLSLTMFERMVRMPPELAPELERLLVHAEDDDWHHI